MTPARLPLDVARNLYPKLYPRMVEILQLLGASGLMATPTEADFQGRDRRRRRASTCKRRRATREERVKLFRLGWDVACSSFGGRQELYERFFFGDPVRMASALYLGYDKQPLMDRIAAFLDGDRARSVGSWSVRSRRQVPAPANSVTLRAPRPYNPGGIHDS